jgi:hypothetical protein
MDMSDRADERTYLGYRLKREHDEGRWALYSPSGDRIGSGRWTAMRKWAREHKASVEAARLAEALEDARVANDAIDAFKEQADMQEVRAEKAEDALREAETLRAKLEAVLMDASVTYAIVNDDGSTSPMMVERLAIVRALGYEDESAWLARTYEINAERRVASPAEEQTA